MNENRKESVQTERKADKQTGDQAHIRTRRKIGRKAPNSEEGRHAGMRSTDLECIAQQPDKQESREAGRKSEW